MQMESVSVPSPSPGPDSAAASIVNPFGSADRDRLAEAEAIAMIPEPIAFSEDIPVYFDVKQGQYFYYGCVLYCDHTDYFYYDTDEQTFLYIDEETAKLLRENQIPFYDAELDKYYMNAIDDSTQAESGLRSGLEAEDVAGIKREDEDEGEAEAKDQVRAAAETDIETAAETEIENDAEEAAQDGGKENKKTIDSVSSAMNEKLESPGEIAGVLESSKNQQDPSNQQPDGPLEMPEEPAFPKKDSEPKEERTVKQSATKEFGRGTTSVAAAESSAPVKRIMLAEESEGTEFRVSAALRGLSRAKESKRKVSILWSPRNGYQQSLLRSSEKSLLREGIRYLNELFEASAAFGPLQDKISGTQPSTPSLYQSQDRSYSQSRTYSQSRWGSQSRECSSLWPLLRSQRSRRTFELLLTDRLELKALTRVALSELSDDLRFLPIVDVMRIRQAQEISWPNATQFALKCDNLIADRITSTLLAYTSPHSPHPTPSSAQTTSDSSDFLQPQSGNNGASPLVDSGQPATASEPEMSLREYRTTTSLDENPLGTLSHTAHMKNVVEQRHLGFHLILTLGSLNLLRQSPCPSPPTSSDPSEGHRPDSGSEFEPTRIVLTLSNSPLGTFARFEASPVGTAASPSLGSGSGSRWANSTTSMRDLALVLSTARDDKEISSRPDSLCYCEVGKRDILCRLKSAMESRTLALEPLRNFWSSSSASGQAADEAIDKLCLKRSQFFWDLVRVPNATKVREMSSVSRVGETSISPRLQSSAKSMSGFYNA